MTNVLFNIPLPVDKVCHLIDGWTQCITAQKILEITTIDLLVYASLATYTFFIGYFGIKALKREQGNTVR